MFKRLLIVITCLMSLNVLAGESKVSWQTPEKFTDIYPSIENKYTYQKELFAVFEQHFEELASQLPVNYQLNVNMTNVDLAGSVTFANSYKIRVIETSTPPRIEFRFEVMNENKKVLIARDVYLWPKHFKFKRSLNVNKPYYHEKALITDWFEKTFAPALTKS